MSVHRKTIEINSSGKGTIEITAEVMAGLRESGLRNGMATVFVRHTSCSLVLMENADPSARRDLERFMEDLVPENYPHFTHTHEGPDDMPSHVKMSLTRSSESIPFADGQLLLGTWQGVFLWEHRANPHCRKVILSYLGDDHD
jgi:secondary thiamine-phosphate synthase enzyme